MSRVDLYLLIAIAQVMVSFLALFEFMGEWKERGKTGRQIMRLLMAFYFTCLAVFGIFVWTGVIT